MITAEQLKADAAVKVAAGVAFMNNTRPGWWRADAEQPVSLDELNLVSLDDCVLGQTCPLDGRGRDYPMYYWHAAILTGIQPYEDSLIDVWAEPLGFNVSRRDPDQTARLHALTAEWKRVITGLRERAAASDKGNADD